MSDCFVTEGSNDIPIRFFKNDTFLSWISTAKKSIQNWAESVNFTAAPGSVLLVPNTSGDLSEVWCGVSSNIDSFWAAGQLPLSIPDGLYSFYFADQQNNDEQMLFYLAYGLGSYQFSHYKKHSREPAKLKLDKSNYSAVKLLVDETCFVRDLINTPAQDMGPTEIANIAKKTALKFGASFKQIVGDELLSQRLEAIYTVGKASADLPRLIDINWGDTNHPKVTLVGKGVCFDSGGLNLKSASGMQIMKKDMGGAATVLGLARLIMSANLPVCLRILIPAVENSVAGDAYRPGDVITMHNGTTVEVGNTDAEGRLVLADALSLASLDKPEILIDIATLTGAARVAVGTEISAFFCNETDIANELTLAGEKISDPLWRLPLYAPYRELLDSQIANFNNIGSDAFAGASIAALFLQEFVDDEISWLHLDLMAWNVRQRPGRPVGGEAMGMRVLFAYLAARFK